MLVRAAAVYIAAGLAAAAGLSLGAQSRSSDSGLADARALVDAARARDLETVDALLRQSADVDAPQPDGATPIAWAAHWNDLDIASALIRAGADVNAANDLGITPLMLAGTNGSAAMVGALLQAGADPNAAAPDGATALMMAARSGSVEAVRLLLDHGAAINAATAAGRTALMWAAFEHHAESVRLLTTSGADVHARTAVVIPPEPASEYASADPPPRSRFVAENPRDYPRDGAGDPPRPEGGFTPLLYAVQAGDLDAIEALLAAGAAVTDAGPDGVTTLMLAITKRHGQIALYLLKRGADPHPAEPGYTALHLASATGQLQVAEELLIRGADPNVRLERPQRLTDAFESGVFRNPGHGRLTQIGSTPLIVAARSADARMMRLLAAHGADPRLTTNDGTTALMLAAGLGKRAATDVTYFDWTPDRAVEALAAGIELGIDVNAANVHGETALHAAAYHGADPVIEFLVESGAAIDAQNAAEQTALRIAEGHLICCTSFAQHPSSAELLLALGADPDAGIQLIFGLTAPAGRSR